MTYRAVDLFFDFDGFLDSFRNFFQGEGKFYPQIGPTGSAGSSSAGLSAAEKGAESAPASEYITKLFENVLHGHAAMSSKTTMAIYAGMSVSIITGTLISVAQNFICFSRFFELVFCHLIIRISVGMIFHSYFTISCLDFTVIRGSSYSENLIIISLRHKILSFSYHHFCMS